MFARAADLELHKKHEGKLAVMQRVPLPDAEDFGIWFNDLGRLLRELYLD